MESNVLAVLIMLVTFITAILMVAAGLLSKTVAGFVFVAIGMWLAMRLGAETDYDY